MKFSTSRNRYVFSTNSKVEIKQHLSKSVTRDKTSEQEIGVFQQVFHINGNFLRSTLHCSL